jgi:hypothetical protein
MVYKACMCIVYVKGLDFGTHKMNNLIMLSVKSGN